MGLMDILNQYAGMAPGTAAPEAGQHFSQVAQDASREEIGQGLSEAFRADQTPPFGEMVGHLFGRSDPQQRAGVLNQLIQSLGPAVLGSIAGGSLGGLMRRGATSVTPDEAAQVDPGDVQDLAHHAAAQNPGIIDRISEFYAQHPALVQTLGSAALTIALSRMAQRRAA